MGLNNLLVHGKISSKFCLRVMPLWRSGSCRLISTIQCKCLSSIPLKKKTILENVTLGRTE